MFFRMRHIYMKIFSKTSLSLTTSQSYNSVTTFIHMIDVRCWNRNFGRVGICRRLDQPHVTQSPFDAAKNNNFKVQFSMGQVMSNLLSVQAVIFNEKLCCHWWSLKASPLAYSISQRLGFAPRAQAWSAPKSPTLKHKQCLPPKWNPGSTPGYIRNGALCQNKPSIIL